jgi:5-methylcytosine-specific restriction endonuclease McrA
MQPMIDKQPGLWIYPDGREVIQRTAAGRKILQERWNTAWRESQGFCCLCSDIVHPFDATLEHKTSKGSGGGTHDDRQENLGISHRNGNIAKGSMSLEQYLKLPLDVRIRNCG